MQHKKCTKCGEEKPATPEYFYTDSQNKSGLKMDCKQCKKAYREANKESIRKVGKAWCEANKEHLKEYREANKESLKEYREAYRRTPKGRYSKIKSNAKAREINFALPFQIYESKLWGEPCHYCGVDIEVTGLDRKDSSKGYTPDNVVPCCRNCNTKKSTKLYKQFLEEIKKNTCIS